MTPTHVYERVRTGFFARWMRRRRWTGVTLPLPFRRAVILYWLAPSPETVKHEWAHVAQIERYGFFGVIVRYLWLLARHGYRNHPHEIEARRVAGQE